MSEKDNIQQIYPLTPMQEGMLFHALRDASSAYFSQTSYTARGELNPEALALSLDALARRHDILRTSFVFEKVEQPLQVVLRHRRIELRTHDLTALSPEQAAARVAEYQQQDVARGFDLTRDPLIRLTVLQTGPRTHEFVWSYHHMLMDGWCLSTLLTELREIYRATQAGLPVPLPPAVPFGRYVKWLGQQDKAAAAAYWQQYLRGYETRAALPPDREPAAGAPAVAPESATLRLPAADTRRLEAWARQQHTTLNTVFQAVWGILLARYANVTDVVYGNVVSGRPADLPDADRMIGLFINTVPLRVRYSGTTRFDELVRQLHQDAVEAVPHHHQPLVETQAATELRSELIQHVVAFENYPVDEELLAAPESDDPFSLGNVAGYEQTHYHLDVDVEIGRELMVTIYFSPLHYSPAYVQRLCGHLGRLFEQVLAAPTALVAELELLTPAERAEQLHQLNRGAVDLGNDRPINVRFEDEAARCPEAPAVLHNDVCWTYAQLNEAANRIGHQLQALGVAAEDFVGVNLERGPALVAAILGVLKLGARYVPLDVQNPAARNRELLSSSGMRGLVTDAAGLAALLPTTADTALPIVLSVDELPAATAAAATAQQLRWADASALTQAPAHNLPNQNRLDSWAYMLYTSGSTGKPKGAITRHDGAMNHILAEIDELGLAQGFRFLQSASISSDISVWQILGPLMHGGATVIIDKDDLLNYEAVLRLLARHAVTIVEFVPSYLLGLTEYIESYYAAANPLPALQWVMMAGEEVHVALVNQWLRLLPGCRVVNGYGPCEASDDISQYLMTEPLGPEVRKVSIGRPIANMNIFVADRFGRLLPRGIAGELVVSGVGVGAGYWQDAERTAASFVPNRFEGTLGDTIYRTGDLARWLPDGNLEFLGRIDNQVKIRGYRVELGEIENRLRTCPAVQEVAVVIRPYQGERQPIAYLIPRQPEAVTDAALQQQVRDELMSFVKTHLAAYMHPAEYVLLSDFPRNLSDKVDRKALPEPGAGLRRTVQAPVGDTETRLLSLWQKVLAREVIGTDENFFDIGGHSLKATRLVAHINKAFDANLTVRTIFAAPTIQQLARALRSGSAAYQPIPAAPVQASYPLSHAQRRLWLVNQLNPEEQFSYNMTGAYRLTGPLQPAALAEALRLLVARHEILRTVFVTEAGEPRQRVGNVSEEHALRYDDWRGQPHDEAAALTRAQEDFRTVFSLSEGPLFRARLVQLADEDFLFVLVLHHIVADGWSSDILIGDLLTLYHATLTGTGPALEPLAVQYKDFAVWHNAELAGPAAEQHRRYWLEQFSGEVPVLELPTDYPRPAQRSQRGAVVELRLDAATTAGLRQLSARRGATLFMSLVASVKALLYRYTGQTDLVVGTVASGREHSDLENQIGFYVNTLPLRTRLAGTASFEQLLDQVKQVALGAFEHQAYPFDQLVDDLNVARELSRSPLFDVLVVLQNNGADDEAATLLPELRLRAAELPQEYSKFDLTVEVWEEADTLTVALEYSTDLFSAARIERLAGHYAQLLRAIIADAGTALDALDYLPAAEQAELLALAGTTAPVPAAHTVPALFEQVAAQYPAAVAVGAADQVLTYQELNARANQLAACLREQYGVGHEDIVGLALTRRPEVVLAMLAILKAGAAYLPFEANQPAERVAELLADTRARVLITDVPALAAQVEACPVLAFDERNDAGYPADNQPYEALHSGSLAYVMYTSGSTGKPKGVLIEHGSIVRLVRDTNYTAYGPGQRMLQTGSLGFDAATFEIWGPLLNGGQVYLLALEHLLDTERLAQAIGRYGITEAFFTTSWFNQLADEQPALFGGLTRVLTGGEKMSEAHVRRVQQHCPGLEVVNVYGPTENTSFSTYYKVPAPAPAAIPLGRPVGRSTVYVVDARGQLVPKGVPGELWLGGEGVARGYWQDAERTQQQFVPNPFGPGRLYRSGDLARWREDGNLEFLGRIDNQVKIRGFRVEPDEVASVLKTYPGVAEAFVLVQADEAGDKLLVAYYTAPTEAPRPELLRAFLKNQLPAYMVPALLVPLTAVPLNQNGKLDRRALPDIGPLLRAQATAATGPDTLTEAVLLGIWAEVLGRGGIGTTDNFFDIGGNSLKAVRILARVQTELGRKIGLAEFFQHPSVQALAALLDQQPAAAPEAGTIPPVAPAPRYEVSRAQKRLWIMDQLEADRAAYNIIGAYVLPAALDAAALAEAVRRLVTRHEILRTVLVAEDGQPYQHVVPAAQATAVALAVQPVPAPADFDAAVARAVQAEEQHLFDLEALPLLRLRLLTDEASRHALVLNLHHVVGDGWSVQLLLQELAAHYQAVRAAAPALPALPIQYKDYAAWHNQQLQQAPAQRAEAYWLAQLGGADARPELPLDQPRAALRSYASAVLPFELPAPVAEALRQLCQQHEASLFMGLQALVKVWLARHLGTEAVTVGTTTAGREQPELAAQLGCYVNVLALRSQVTGSFAEVLRTVRQDTLGAFEHQAYPFDLLVEKLGLRRDLSRNLLFDVMLNFLDGFDMAEEEAPEALRFEEWNPAATDHTNKYDLTLAFQSQPTGAIGAELIYSTDLFRPGTAAAFRDELLALAAQLVQDPAAPLPPRAAARVAPAPLAISLEDDFA